MLTLATTVSCWPPNMTAIPAPSSTNSTPSNHEGANRHPSWRAPAGFPLPLAPICGYTHARAVVVVEGATVRPLSHGAHGHDHLRTTPRHRRHRLLLLAAV